MANRIFREMDAVGEWSHSSDMDCEKDKQRIRRLVKPLEINPNLTNKAQLLSLKRPKTKFSIAIRCFQWLNCFFTSVSNKQAVLHAKIGFIWKKKFQILDEDLNLSRFHFS